MTVLQWDLARTAQAIEFCCWAVRKGVRLPVHQEVLTAQPAVLIGSIAHIVGTPLQDDIVRTTDRLRRLGQDILATSAARTATPVPDGGESRPEIFCRSFIMRPSRSA